jgi:hypothetical protein
MMLTYTTNQKADSVFYAMKNSKPLQGVD